MDNQSPASPASSASGSDDDGVNSESARVYFGPVKTPERNFMAANNLLPPPVPSTLRRSPRLSSPRPQVEPKSDSEEEETMSAVQESKEVELVAQLVNEVEVDDDEEMDNIHRTPPKEEWAPDGTYIKDI